MTLEFRILGDIALFRDGAPIDLGGRRPRALLALLLAERGRSIPIDTIVDRLWRDEPPDTAVKTIQVYVSRLRAGLGTERDRIATRAGGYALQVASEELDAARLEAGVIRARERLRDGDSASALELAVAASDNYRGRPFGDLADESFLLSETGRLEDLATEAEELRASALVGLGRPEEAIGPLRRLVAEQPARESAWAQLLLALYAANRQADALAAFVKVRSYLDAELGVEPGPELQAAQLAVLRQSVAPPFTRPSAMSGLGPVLERPSGLVGRESDVAALEELFAAGTRLLTVTGPGGIGKTTLARELLARLQPTVQGPVRFVELDALRGPELVPAAVAATLDGEGGVELQLGDREAWLCLDNLEHLLDATPWIDGILSACPGLRILATTREPLRIECERIYPLGPLSEEGARELFLARARRSRPELAPTAAIDTICERLDRLPLAVELAAARTSLLSPEALLGRLDRALDVLGRSKRDHVDRQRTLRTTIAWSYDLLDADLQDVFRRLGVFVGGFGVDAAETVASASLDDLERLLEQSLLTARYDAAEPRFRMLETIRAFAWDRLAGLEAAGEREQDAVRMAHAAWALETVRRAGADGSERERAVGTLVTELDNLRAAMAWATENRVDVTRWRIAVGLSEVWQTRGYLAEAQEWLESGLDEADLPDDLRLDALDDASTMAFRQGRLDEARRLAERQLELAERLVQPRRRVGALAKLAQISLRTGDPAESRRLHAEALVIARRDADPRPLMVSLSSQANADLLAGRADLATPAFEEVLRVADVVGRPETVATSWFNLGLARLIEGTDVPGARAALVEAERRYVELDDTEGLGYVLVAVAGLASATDPATAAVALGASSKALASVDAELEAVEAALRSSLEVRLIAALGTAAFASAISTGAGLSAADRLSIASRVLTEAPAQDGHS